MSKIIKLTENDIKNIVLESVDKLLKEYIEIAKNVPSNIQKQYLAKIRKERSDLDPTGFSYIGNKLIHNGRKAQKKQIISKPKDMSVEEYYQKLVLPNNVKMAEQENEYSDEDWRPVQNIGRYFNGDVDYGSYYEVSNYGRLKTINFNNALRSNIQNGYDAPTRNAMQFHLNGNGNDGSSMKTCPDVKYIVADAWLEPHNPKEFKVIHIDGDYHNNKVDNLKWIPRKR